MLLLLLPVRDFFVLYSASFLESHFNKARSCLAFGFLMTSDGCHTNLTRVVACMDSCPKMNTGLIEKTKYTNKMYLHKKFFSRMEKI